AYVLNPTLSNLRIEHIGVGNYQDQTIYRLKATDACSTIYSNPTTLTVNEITAISPGTTSTTQTTICEGESFTFNATTSGSPVSYQWQKNSLPLINGTFSGVTISGANSPALLVTNASPSETGSYQIQVVFNLVDGSGIPKTCQKTSGLNRNVTVNPKPSISGTLATGTGSTTQLTGSGIAATINPWISANPAIATVDNTGLVTGVAAGTSKITYTDNNGCSVDATVSVSGTADVEVTKSAIASIAPGAWMTYTITITNHGLATAPQITLTDNVPVTLINPQYSINSSGIWNNWTGTVDIFNLPNTGIETILIKAKVDCSANGSISNTASVALSSITDSNPSNNTFTVNTPVSGSPLTISAVPTNASCSGLADGAINLTVSGGTPYSIAPYYTYSWTGPGTFNSSSEDISGLVTGTYIVSVSDASGCTISDSYPVGTSPDITPPIFTTPVLTAGYCPIDIFQAIYNEDQSDPDLDLTFPRPDYYLFGAGNILLDLPNVADNCALASNPIAWTIDFGNNGSADLSGTGQISTYGSPIQFPVGDNLIKYTVTDAAGKTATDAVILTVIPRPVMTPNF
ncbi:MAG: Ig-like domain-containing protein, partial [Prolixibacteraceae bacterium]